MPINSCPFALRQPRVVYLFRDPVATVQSNLAWWHGGVAPLSGNRVRLDLRRYSVWYGQHLMRWLVDEDFAAEKLLLCYDCMMKRQDRGMGDLARFFARLEGKEGTEGALSFDGQGGQGQDMTVDSALVDACAAGITKDETRK